MKSFFLIVFYCFLITGSTQLFAQAKVVPKNAVNSSLTKPKPVPVKPVQKANPAAKPKPKATVKQNPKKLPAKTSPSVTVKIKDKANKIIIKQKPAKLPEGVDKDETAIVKPGYRETEMMNEINNLRRDPKRYIPFVEEHMKKHRSNSLMQKAGKELIQQLKELPPLSELTFNPVMYSAAKQFGLYLSKEDLIEHSELPYIENLSFGHPTIKEAILDLLIDDDIPDRGHRMNLLNEKLTKIAVYEVPGTLQGYRNCFVQEFK